MDDCIGRLDIEVGVDRTATEQAACNVVHWPINGGRVLAFACADHPVGTLDNTLQTVRATAFSHKLDGAQVRLCGPTADTDPATATQWRPVVMSKATNHARERALMSAAGGVAGAISCRSPRN